MQVVAKECDMFVFENNTFKFVLEKEIGDIGSTEGVTLITVDVWQKTGLGEEWIATTHLEQCEADALADFLTHGELNKRRAQSECHRDVWSPTLNIWVPCGNSLLCPACEGAYRSTG
jgi:hypothetical protein